MVPADKRLEQDSPSESKSVPPDTMVFPPWTRDEDLVSNVHVEVKRKTRGDSMTAGRPRQSKQTDNSSASDDSDDSDSDDDNQKKQQAVPSPVAKQIPDPQGFRPSSVPNIKLEREPTRTIDLIPASSTTLSRAALAHAIVVKAEDDDNDEEEEKEKKEKKEEERGEEVEEHEEEREGRNNGNGRNGNNRNGSGSNRNGNGNNRNGNNRNGNGRLEREERPNDHTAFQPLDVTNPVIIDLSTTTTNPPRRPISSPPAKSREEKGVLQPVVTVTQSATPSATAIPADEIRGSQPIKMEASFRHDYTKTEKALIAIGAVGAVIIVFFVTWLAWKCFKMHKRSRRRSLTTSRQWPRPRQLMTNLASRVPILKQRVATRSWSNLDRQHQDAVWAEKSGLETFHNRSSSGITVHTAIMTKSERQGTSSSPSWSLPHHQQQSMSPIPRSQNTLSGLSSTTSLSSGFGDGDIIIPQAMTGTATAKTVTTISVPAPIAAADPGNRDTVYTEATEASDDTVPRFRSINSWVRQQSGRMKRAGQRRAADDGDKPPLPALPPEQDFRLMMPDNEVPRRVDEVDIIDGYGAAA